MLHIMQDYGEVVCVLGSAANAENMPIFMQADAGYASELYWLEESVKQNS